MGVDRLIQMSQWHRESKLFEQLVNLVVARWQVDHAGQGRTQHRLWCALVPGRDVPVKCEPSEQTKLLRLLVVWQRRLNREAHGRFGDRHRADQRVDHLRRAPHHGAGE